MVTQLTPQINYCEWKSSEPEKVSSIEKVREMPRRALWEMPMDLSPFVSCVSEKKTPHGIMKAHDLSLYFKVQKQQTKRRSDFSECGACARTLACVHAHMDVYSCACLCTCACACAGAHLCECERVCVGLYMHVCVHACACTCVCTRVCVYAEH